ncbi:MAG: glycerate kinase [Lentimonas sp.]|jgi:glycerate kinase
MHILAAFDKFKDSMTAAEACQAAAQGIVEARPRQATTVTLAPLTDGGEGFCAILTRVAAGHIEYHTVSGPLGEEIEAPLGWVECANLPDAVEPYMPLRSGRLAIIEMAAVAGLEQVPRDQRHPANCSTFGVGELIRIAIAQEAVAILIGIGGSATSDLGLGALEALGLKFVARNGSILEQFTPQQWPFLVAMEGTIELEIPPIYIACDVDNPLLGPRGAAATYGPQKGLKPEEIEPFDAEAAHLARLLCKHFNRPSSLTTIPGSGAAGGIGFGLKVACGADFIPGFALVTAWLDLKQRIAEANLVLTGEGQFDQSSLAGKGPFALIAEAHKTDTQTLLFSGAINPEAADKVQELYPGCALYTITPKACPLEQALLEAPSNLKRKVAEVIQHCYPA